MKTGDILAEIRRTRDELVQEADDDVDRHFDYVRQREREAAARGVKFVSHAAEGHPEPCVVMREGPRET